MSQMAAVVVQEQAKAARASTSVALRRKCNRYCEKEKLLHRSVISPAQDTVPPIVHDAPPSREPRFGRDFSQIPVHSRAQADLQTKLIVNAPGDIYEEEADRVAEEVMRMPPMAESASKPNPAVANRVRASAGLVQREPDSSDKQGDCSGWERDCESFCRRAAKQYWIDIGVSPPPVAESPVECDTPFIGPGGKPMRGMCFLKYKNGVTVTVGRTDPGKNIEVWQTKPNDKTGSNEYSGPVCKYRYFCTKRQSDLVLEKKFCYDPRTEKRPKETEPESSPSSLIQRSTIGELNVAQAPPVVQDVLNSSGRALDPATRGFMEDRFGRDFSGVCVHTDERAMKSAGMINARAYTSGSHIVFGAGGFSPGTHHGRRLIAHELTHVVQQNKGSIALQRQPQDIDVLLHEAMKVTEDLENIRKQLREGAEDLEIFRWLLALQGKELPKAATPIANMKADVASFAEGLIETSAILRPYLRGKLAGTTVAKNFKIYDFRSSFESKQDELERRVTPSIGKPAPKTLTYGFYHRRTDSIHLPPDAKFSDALHEAVHKYSSIAIQNALGVFVNEGFTQHFTDQVLAERSLGSASSIYGPNLKCANILLNWINNDELALARAYFQGYANPLMQEVMRRLGLTTAKALIQLREEGAGLGLCERIKQKGP